MEVKFVDLKKNYEKIKDHIFNNVNDLFNKCDFIGGESVKIFEKNFADYLGIKHFIGCANGTDALEIAVKMLNLEKDDEIIVQGNTYIATCLGVLNNDIKLVLCDIDENTHQIDVESLESKITNKTKAVIVVHLYGLMPDMDKIMNIINKHNLYLIEDCAQAHGAKWNGKMAGTFGNISCFSFYPGKNLGAYGDGGGIATNDDLLNEKIRLNCNLGCRVKYHHEVIGRNSRLDTLQASFLNTKLQFLDSWNNMRKFNAGMYCKFLKDVGDIQLPKIYELCDPVYHLFVIKTKYRDQLQKYLKENKIDALIHYPISISETEAMLKYNFNKDEIKKCITNSNEILSLPMYPELDVW
jgi:dTDP-4-amino-4,6-dideoxygalactose transaminase